MTPTQPGAPDAGALGRPTDPPTLSRRWLLLVAVAKYGAGDDVLRPLPGVISDVNRLYGVIHKSGHLPLAKAICLYNEQATRKAIIDAVVEIAKESLESDQIVIYFGGHGHQGLEGDSPGLDGMTPYLMPYDARPETAPEYGITTNQLAEKLALLQAREVVVILDCCYSEGLSGVFWRDLARLQQGQQSRYVMASAQRFEVCADLDTGGPFTQSLCDALQGRAEVRTSADGLVSAAAAFEHAEQTLGAAAKRIPDLQMPRHFGYGSTVYLTRPSRLPLTSGEQNHSGVEASLDALRRQLVPWWEALGYQLEPHPTRGGDCLEWIINAPVRRGYDRILVRAIAGHGRLADVDDLLRSVEKYKADEGWLVAARVLDQTVREAILRRGKRKLFGYTFDERVEEEVDSSPYFAWLDHEVSTLGIDRLYVPLACTKPEFHPVTNERMAEGRYDRHNGWMEGYLDTWLDYPGREHISILGEFGMGKTWFALRYAWVLSQRYREAGRRGLPLPRLPLFIPLRDYAKAVTVTSLFSEFFFRKHNFKLPSYRAFEQLNRMGRLLILFDGFDEMAVRVDRQKMVDNFQELASVVVPGSKAILTSRIEHFSDISEAIEILNRGPVQFELLELEHFDKTQVRRALKRRRARHGVIDGVMANEDLLDFARRPLMIQYIIEALPGLPEGSPVDPAHVYLYALRHFMEQDIAMERTFTSEADKFYFFAELAWEMLRVRQFKLNFRDFPDRVRRIFKDVVRKDKTLDHWRHDLQRCGLLVHTEEGDYAPAHRSLLEFFAAYRFVALLGIMAPEFVAPAAQQSHADRRWTPRPYTWGEYFAPELDAEDRRKPIAPLMTFRMDQPQRIQELGVLREDSNVMVFAAGMVSSDPESVQRLVDMVLDRDGQASRTAQYLLPYLKHRKQAKALARRIAGKDPDRPLPPGVAFVLGELGQPLPGVVAALRRTIAAHAAGEKGASAFSWWTAAFALEKLDRLPAERPRDRRPPEGEAAGEPGALSPARARQGDAPIAYLTRNLPKSASIADLKRRLAGHLENPSKDEFDIDETDVVLLVQHEADPDVQLLFQRCLGLLDFATDTKGKRTYRMSWLCGHLGGRVGFGAECVQRALAATRNPRGSVRNCALEALGKIGNPTPGVIQALEQGLNDSYYRARFHAVWALTQLRSTASLPKLTAALRLEQVLDVQRELQRAKELLSGR